MLEREEKSVRRYSERDSEGVGERDEEVDAVGEISEKSFEISDA